MIDYADLEWFIMFPFLCSVMMWFSIDLALLVRIAGGRRRRKRTRAAIEQMVLEAPATLIRPISAQWTSMKAASPGTSPHVGNRSGRNSRSNNNHSNSGGGGVSPYRRSHHQDEADSAGAMATTDVHAASEMRRYKKVVDIPALMRVATKAVMRRAVVVVGGDFARSPRMQYHAASLAQSGLFDEVVLVGLDCGNELSEALRRSGTPDAEVFELADPQDEREVQTIVWEKFREPHDRREVSRTGCLISDRYLVAPPTPPEWFQIVFPLRTLHWVACTLYRVIAFTLLFAWLVAKATAIRVNAHGQLLLTDLIIVQTPPAVPFVPLIKYLVRPTSFLYSTLVYYGLLVPASWFNHSALKEIREQSHPQSAPIFKTSASSPDGTESDANHAKPSHGSTITRGRRHSRRGTEDEERKEGFTPRSVRGRQLAEWWQSGYARGSIFWPALVVDWHNFGYTILRAAHRPAIVSESYRFLELNFCAGDINLTVSRAMRQFMIDNCIVPSELSHVKKAAVAGSDCTCVTGTDHRLCQGSGKGAVVEVLHDAAPSFFGLRSRRAFIDDVLMPIQRASAEAEAYDRKRLRRSGGVNEQAEMEEALHDLADAANHATRASAAGAPRAGLWQQDSAWGIHPPPAWVTEEVQATLSPSNMGNGVSGGNNGSGSGRERLQASGHGSVVYCNGMNSHGKRGLMVVGSTSWTEDDDYTILVEALQRLDHRLKHAYKYLTRGASPANRHSGGGTGSSHSSNEGGDGSGANSRGASVSPPTPLPLTATNNISSNTSGAARTSSAAATAAAPLDVWVLITGKGPARDRFEDAVRAANLSSHVIVSTVYLQSYQQYSITLGAADVGLCLHFSSSGLDLPMKGVDMIGSGLPILAHAYLAIDELVGARMGGGASPTRHYSHQAISGSGHDSGTGGSNAGPVEHQYGWVFSSAAELERLLGRFIGLDHNSVGDGVHGRPLASPFLTSSAAASGAGVGTGVAASGGVALSSTGMETAAAAASPFFATDAAGVCGSSAVMAPRATDTPLAPLAAAQQRVRSAKRTTWEENWSAVVKPILDEIV